jgi:hypothetical protein
VKHKNQLIVLVQHDLLKQGTFYSERLGRVGHPARPHFYADAGSRSLFRIFVPIAKRDACEEVTCLSESGSAKIFV